MPAHQPKPPHTAALQPGQMLAPYRLVEKIGEGGMGVVRRAEDSKLGRAVALKALPAAMAGDPERLARFERETRVLDFGPAKAPASEDRESSTGNLSLTPTVTMPATRSGVIMGTPSCMSPEQAKGRPIDRRCDIRSFGGILYERLTGRRLFQGETVSEQLASVLRGEVDLASLPAETPVGIQRLVGRCLDRNPCTRLQSMGEARILLEAAVSGSPDDEEARAPFQRARSTSRAAVPLAALVLLLAGIAAGVLSPWSDGSGEIGPAPPPTDLHRADLRPGHRRDAQGRWRRPHRWLLERDGEDPLHPVPRQLERRCPARARGGRRARAVRRGAAGQRSAAFSGPTSFPADARSPSRG